MRRKRRETVEDGFVKKVALGRKKKKAEGDWCKRRNTGRM